VTWFYLLVGCHSRRSPIPSVLRADVSNKVFFEKNPALPRFRPGDLPILGLSAKRLAGHLEKGGSFLQVEGFAHDFMQKSRHGKRCVAKNGVRKAACRKKPHAANFLAIKKSERTLFFGDPEK